MLAKISRPVAVLGVGVLMTSLTACSGGNSEPTTSPTPVATTTTVSDPTNKPEPAPTVTVTQQQTKIQTQAPEPKPAENAFPAGQQVAAEAFQTGPETHNWTSPTGRIYCGVVPGAEQIMAGCQMASALPECGPDHNLSAPLVHFADRAVLTRTCTTQGIYVRSDSKVLEYGQQIDIGPFTAVSQQDGMYMRHRQTGEAFKIAVEGIETFKTAI